MLAVLGKYAMPGSLRPCILFSRIIVLTCYQHSFQFGSFEITFGGHQNPTRNTDNASGLHKTPSLFKGVYSVEFPSEYNKHMFL